MFSEYSGIKPRISKKEIIRKPSTQFRVNNDTKNKCDENKKSI